MASGRFGTEKDYVFEVYVAQVKGAEASIEQVCAICGTRRVVRTYGFGDIFSGKGTMRFVATRLPKSQHGRSKNQRAIFTCVAGRVVGLFSLTR